MKNIDIRGYEPVYNSEHAEKFCAADIFNPLVKNVSCNHVAEYIPQLVIKYGQKTSITAKTRYILYIVIGVSAFIILFILLCVIYIILKVKNYTFF
ncbi:hypothetical protein A3Q56_06704 [Intoshia linei]|uniref:Uncharacterized protein n=1 Tax=Intoshia linei TaxID=1819745 RepID=A0A177AU89_9BILA|nr:hypothetical protein A3Q56_06704 [Intoshia linei]